MCTHILDVYTYVLIRMNRKEPCVPASIHIGLFIEKHTQDVRQVVYPNLHVHTHIYIYIYICLFTLHAQLRRMRHGVRERGRQQGTGRKGFCMSIHKGKVCVHVCVDKKNICTYI